MINFQVSAPGKLNLFGEYLTCNDHNGVMASIDQRNTVTFNELPRSEDAIKLNVAEINLYCTIRLRRFQNFYRRCTFDDTLSEQILQFISAEHLTVEGCRKKIGHAIDLFACLCHVQREHRHRRCDTFQNVLESAIIDCNFRRYSVNRALEKPSPLQHRCRILTSYH